MILSRSAFEALVMQANLAPSVHNTQPTRWRLQSDGSVLVLEDVRRRLPVGDPDGRDAMVSHGAAIEGFAIACSPSLSVSVEQAEGAQDGFLRPVAKLALSAGVGADPLLGALASRRTYRGAFTGAPCHEALDRLAAAADIRIVRDPAGIAFLARLNDTASLRTMRDAAFRAELVSWMRLSRRHPDWNADGLNAEAMQMSGAEAAAAGIVLRPGVFEALDRIGLAAPLTGDAKIVRSAAAIALFHNPVADDLIEVGRRYHRFWLELTAFGLAAAPMSVLADDRRARDNVCQEFGVPAGNRLITAFRLGVAPTMTITPKPRLPPDAILL